MLLRYQAAVKTMTQEQVDACTWLLYGMTGVWNPVDLAAEYDELIVQKD